MGENQGRSPGYGVKGTRSRSSTGKLGAESLVKEQFGQKFSEKSLLEFTFSTTC